MLPIGQSVIWVSLNHLELLEAVDQVCKGLAGNIAQPMVTAEESQAEDVL